MRTRHLVTAPLVTLCAAGLAAAPALAGTGDHHRQHAHHHHHQVDHHWRGGHHRREKHHGSWNGGGSGGRLPEKALESALQLQATKSQGDLNFSFDRTDINNVTLNGTPIKPSFEINGTFDFQPLGGGQAFFNGDIPLKPGEIDPVIHTAIKDGITVQAEHQHMYDFSPMVWFVHLRAKGNAVKIAQGLHDVLAQTSTPLPQSPPSNPQTPLNVQRLQSILHGYSAQVGSDGVVTVFVARRNPVHINGVLVKPATNIATNIAFEPLNSSGTQVAAMPDFAMTANETNNVISTMQGQGWDIGCLYNQETDEHPQLYFSHQFKTGNPYQLAQQIRNGLNQTNSR